MTRLRSEVPLDDQWDVTSFFAGEQDWNKALAVFMQEQNPPAWPKLAALQGTLHEGNSQVKKSLEEIFKARRALEKLYVYAHLRRDVNTADDVWVGHFKRMGDLFQDFGAAVSWFDPELLELPEESIKALLEDKALSEYRFYLQKIVRMRPHTLPKEQELLIAESDKALRTARRAFSAFNDSDVSFPTICDAEGKQHELTHGSYMIYLHHPDRVLRRNAFLGYSGTYGHYAHTLTELLAGNAQRNAYLSHARGYSSCLEAALDVHNIDVAVYHSLIDTVRKNISSLHAYMQLVKEVLGLESLHPYDLYVSFVKEYDVKVPYDLGQQLVVESVSPLGPEYQNVLKKGLYEERWVDRYENRCKRPGAYSSGCYDSHPFILMNYKQMIQDVSTLAHEAGHSMHSYFSTKHQTYHDSDYPIFVAEVASTFNEELLSDLLMKRASSDAEKAYLIHDQIEKIRRTFFRQTLFAEFELFMHTCVEQQQPITPKLLQEHYMQLLRDYYGPAVTWDDESAFEAFRIPHFYSSFYVYQYATGLSAAITLASHVRDQVPGAKERYLKFLQSGGSRYPIDLLAEAGVDMRTPEPVEQTITRFNQLVEQLRGLLRRAP